MTDTHTHSLTQPQTNGHINTIIISPPTLLQGDDKAQGNHGSDKISMQVWSNHDLGPRPSWSFVVFIRTVAVSYSKSEICIIFIRPSSDGTYYGMVMSVRLRLSVRPSGSPSTRFPHFFHTCFDILSWNFAHHFVLLYYRSSSSVVTLRQFLNELCLFWNLEYR